LHDGRVGDLLDLTEVAGGQGRVVRQVGEQRSGAGEVSTADLDCVPRVIADDAMACVVTSRGGADWPDTVTPELCAVSVDTTVSLTCGW
jgi:hypothetical protein